MALQPGNTAPAFTLKHKHADGLDEVSLKALLKDGQKAVLLFFPLAFTSVCQNELCSVSSGLEDFKGAQVVGISVDSPFAQEAFATANKIGIKLLSDFNKTTATAYDVLDQDFLPGKLDFSGVAKRSAFVINPDQTIAYSWSSDNPGDLPDFEAIKAAL
jgi:peroxiredoxin